MAAHRLRRINQIVRRRRVQTAAAMSIEDFDRAMLKGMAAAGCRWMMITMMMMMMRDVLHRVPIDRRSKQYISKLTYYEVGWAEAKTGRRFNRQNLAGLERKDGWNWRNQSWRKRNFCFLFFIFYFFHSFSFHSAESPAKTSKSVKKQTLQRNSTRIGPLFDAEGV